MINAKPKRYLLPLLGLLLSASALATPVATTLPACSFTNSVLLNQMWFSTDAGKTNLLPGSVQATSCYGVADMDPGNNPDNLSAALLTDQNGNYNIGTHNVALLNGGETKSGSAAYFDPYYLPASQPAGDPLVHVNPAYGGLLSTSALVDMDGDGQADDPGWVMIGKDDGTKTLQSIQKDGNSLDLSTVLDFNITGIGSTSGTWELDLAANIIQEVQKILGPNAFDHLAFVIKAGTNWAVYDFDFTILSQIFPPLPGNADLFNSVFSFSGTWDTSDLGHAISGLTLWARDPVLTANVPEPGSLALLGLGLALAGLVAARRRRN